MADQNGKGELVPGSKTAELVADTGSGSTAESILKVLMTQLATISKAETVTGTPITADKTTIIPVSKVSIGFAAGGSDAGGNDASSRRGKISVGGTGGGIQVEPIAFIVVGPDGKPTLLPIKGTINSMARVIDLIPDAISKLASMRQGGKKDEQAEEEPPVRKRRPGTEDD